MYLCNNVNIYIFYLCLGVNAQLIHPEYRINATEKTNRQTFISNYLHSLFSKYVLKCSILIMIPGLHIITHFVCNLL